MWVGGCGWVDVGVWVLDGGKADHESAGVESE